MIHIKGTRHGVYGISLALAFCVRSRASISSYGEQREIALHVKPSCVAEHYDHYELCIGAQAAGAWRFNPPNPIRLVPLSELAARWDGCGLIVSGGPIHKDCLFGRAANRFMTQAMMATIVVVLIHVARRRVLGGLLRSPYALLVLSIGQATALAVLVMLFALLYHLFRQEGFLSNIEATTAIQDAHAPDFLPKVSKAKVHRLLNQGVVLVDARLARDYQAGHLDQAINIPVDANDVQRARNTAFVPKDSTIIVYCQSKGCRFADDVALWLKDEGFLDVAIYRGGWSDWIGGNRKMHKEARS
jgi:rhodanese-related sulfurtransferase